MAAQLGPDGDSYRRLFEPYVERFDEILAMALAPCASRSIRFARQFGLDAFRSLAGLARARFSDQAAPALLAGIAAHAMIPLDQLATASFGLVLATAGHAVGWPIVRGGSQAICDALVAKLRAHGGELVVGQHVTSLDELPRARAYLFDVTPRQLLAIAAERLSPRGIARASNAFATDPACFKIDWALRGPVPWRDASCARSATVHLSGTLDDVERSERFVHARGGRRATVRDPHAAEPGRSDTRASPGSTSRGLTATPARARRSTRQPRSRTMSRCTAGVSRARDSRRATMNTRELTAYNPNYIGGDINGEGTLGSGPDVLSPRAAHRSVRDAPAPDIFMCSPSTPPGGGVHGTVRLLRGPECAPRAP